MSGSADAIEDSYRACRRVARRARSSFLPSFLLLGREKRRAMYALYAFLRHTDDLGDQPGPRDSRRHALARWRASLASALSGFEHLAEAPAASAILPALADTVRQYQIPPNLLHAVIDGVEMDLDVHRYQSFAELEQYCHRVASAVGLACVHIWGFRSEEAFVPARQCGVAYQLTNILRDLREDVQADRVYLPLEDLRQCDYAVEDLAAGVVDSRFLRLVDLQIERARRFYQEGGTLADHLFADGRRIFGMMTATYRLLLENIARQKAEVLCRRIRLSRWQKVSVAVRWLLFSPR